MYKLTSFSVISLCFFGYLYNSLDNEEAKIFYLGMVTTIFAELNLLLIYFKYKLKKQKNNTNLTIHFCKKYCIQVTDQLRKVNSLQNMIPSDSSKSSIIEEQIQEGDLEIRSQTSFNKKPVQQDTLDIDQYQRMVQSNSMSDSQSIEDQALQHKDDLKTKIYQFGEKADMYIRHVKDNLFKEQRLPLCKLEKKLTNQRIGCLLNLLDFYSLYFVNMHKSFEQVGQIGLLQKLSTEVSQLQPYDELHTHYAPQSINFETSMKLSDKSSFQQIKLPNWQHLKKAVKNISHLFIKQKQFIQNINQNQVLNMQKEYQARHAEVKKIKKGFQSKYSEAYKYFAKCVYEEEEINNNIEAQNQIFRDLKRKKEDPSKIIKQEMKIKLAEQQKISCSNKLQDAKSRLREVKFDSKIINEQLQEFHDMWQGQFEILIQGLVRSFLQNYLDLQQEELIKLKTLLILEDKRSSCEFSEKPNSTQNQANQLEDQDIMLAIKREKEETIQIMKKQKSNDDGFSQLWRYDGEALGVIIEVREAFRKCDLMELSSIRDQLEPLQNCGLQWVLKCFIEPDGLQQIQCLYNQALQSCNQIEILFSDSKDIIQNGYKEFEQLLKEKANQVAFQFNCILKDSEKLQKSKSSNTSYKDYQNEKDNYLKTFAIYREESIQEKLRLSNYFKRCQELFNQHDLNVSLAKFQIVNTLITFHRSVVRLLGKIIEEFDQQFQEIVQDEAQNKSSTLQDAIPLINLENKRKSVIHINGRQFSFDATPEITNFNDKQRIGPKTISQGNETVIKTDLEKFLISRLMRVLYLEWTRSIFFKEKIMQEMYISLNKKRPKSLDEIMILNVEIKGDPPTILNIIPQKCLQNQFLFDFDISLRGTFILEFETNIIINWPRVYNNIFNFIKPNYAQFPLTVKFAVKSLNGRIRFCFIPSQQGKSWFSFIGEPVMNIEIDPVVGKSQYNLSSLPSITDIIREFLIYKIKKLTYPNKSKLRVPMSDQELTLSERVKQKIHDNVLKWQQLQQKQANKHNYEVDETTNKQKK